MKRELLSFIQRDIKKKIILISGPRQAGKTTLAKMLYSSYDYFNYDEADHRIILNEKSWNRNKPLIILMNFTRKRNGNYTLKGFMM